MTKRTSRKRLLRDDRGSALLVSLMVIVGLSLLGLGFVALSETEATIAKNEQQALQTQAIAEAGAKLVVEWFQDPIWAVSTGGAPANNAGTNPNLAAIKISRFYGSTGGSGIYKPNSNTYLFDKPYRPAPGDRFYGAEQNPDIRINGINDKPTIDRVNAFVLGTNGYDTAGGEIYEIGVYAPPMINNVLTPDPANASNLFWVGNGVRYGVATVKVTAVQLRDTSITSTARYAPSNIKTQHSVKIVVGEIPLPIPGGPIQSNASISFGGDFIVHWGMETATGNLTNKRNPSSLPWANAYERPHFEHGYEPGSSIAQVIVTSGGSGYTSAPLVTIGDPGGGGTTATATATVVGGTVRAVTVDPAGHGSGYYAAPPNWGPVVTFTGGGGSGASAQAVIGAEVWPVVNGSNFDDAPYFQELLNKSFEDPWFGSRSVGDNMADGTTANGVNPMCYPYAYSSIETSANNAPYSFQWQATNTYPWIKKVVFPTIRYDFWKRITKSGKGYKGLYYFNYAGNSTFQKFETGAAQSMYYWANSISPGANLGPGVYFFDTTDGGNPQGIASPTNLTPVELWNSQSFNHSFLMAGFVYMNTRSFGTQGAGNSMTTVNALFPGEPYRDIGYPIWDPAAKVWQTTGCGGQICRAGVGDGIFSYQDLNNNGKFDVVVMSAPAWKSYDGQQFVGTNHNAGSTYIVKTWKSDAQATIDYGAPCTVPAANYNGTNAAATDCSEPHEPYLNLIYPTNATDNVLVGWEAPGNQTYRPKLPSISCTSSSSQDSCTSNAWDENGAMVPIDVILQGILYNEGGYDSQGNSAYYGSVLIQGNVTGTGTPDVWFDETLIKGTWAPPRMPRVIVFSEQTDELGQ
jgi:hypothetical protein